VIVAARLKAQASMALMVGWNARNFHYVKELKPLSEYLDPPEQRRAAKSIALLEMFQRKQKKQGGT